MIGVLAALAAAATRLPPVDQCNGDPAFARFRSELQSAVAREDADRLVALMDDKVLLTFGGRQGRDQFRAHWLSNPAEGAKLWRELRDVLTLGCAVDGESRVFPSMFAQADGLDGFETWIARPGARLRARPSAQAPVVAKLSWHVLTETGSWDGGEWIGVRTGDGRRGYVHRSAARSPIDYRLIAERRGEDWRLTYFIAGD